MTTDAACTHPGPLHKRLTTAPLAADDPRIAKDVEELAGGSAQKPEIADLADLLGKPNVNALIAGIYSGSPYLTGLIRRDPARLLRLLNCEPEAHFSAIKQGIADDLHQAIDQQSAMKALREFKSEVALLSALADLGGVWPVMKVTEVLTETADAALQACVSHLFRVAVEKGEWLATDGDTAPETSSGFIILGMGKHGAFELNYSSDIDLIVFYEESRARLRDGLEVQPFFVRMTRDLVRLMDERTMDGYVFRTDLRLRPDAGATQVALSTDAALIYYESFGQNWERAALIKARCVAGDVEAGNALLKDLEPFIWRRYLDFAAIADVHAMKRQIHAFRSLGSIRVPGHNVKLGPGGIREIEFFTQTQQLIAGGRQRELRTRDTLTTLATLVDKGWITDAVRADMENAYLFLRKIEHRIQMVADEQTHDLPSTDEKLACFARFAGYESLESFSERLLAVLNNVQAHYSSLFEDMPTLAGEDVNLVFAGQDDDPSTVEALAKFGYSQPSQVIATVRGWHHGRYRAVRSPRSRERLTEVQPLLVQAFSETADPDRAIASFDRFISELPTGIQLFSLLRANPNLLRLIADIMGTAPRLARILSRRRRLLDAVIDPRIISALPAPDELDELIAAECGRCKDIQEVLDQSRIVGSEQAFLIGVRILSGTINASHAGQAYAMLAEHLISALQREVEAELIDAHGRVAGGAASVVAMGKLGGQEMTANSDLDLIVVYDFDPDVPQTDGPRPLSPSQYYTRMTQRLISALSAPTAEGTLYEVDMRLRPSGQQGPVATQLSSFVRYQAEDAWTWEHLALTRARVLTGPESLRGKVQEAIGTALTQPRDRQGVIADVNEMRERIAKNKGTDNIWDLKQVRGGLVDLEFAAQCLQLIHAHEHPDVLDQGTVEAYRKLAANNLIDAGHAEVLVPATRMIHDLMQILRLCLDGPFDPATASKGLLALLARAADEPSFESLESRLRQTLSDVARIVPQIMQ